MYLLGFHTPIHLLAWELHVQLVSAFYPDENQGTLRVYVSCQFLSRSQTRSWRPTAVLPMNFCPFGIEYLISKWRFFYFDGLKFFCNTQHFALLIAATASTYPNEFSVFIGLVYSILFHRSKILEISKLYLKSIKHFLDLLSSASFHI